MDSSRPLASSIRISPIGTASVSPIEDVSLNQGDLLTQQVVRSNLAGVNTPSRKRPREKILKSGLCDSCSSTMSAVWRKNKTQCSSCYGKSYKEAHKEEMKAYRAAHKEEMRAYYQAHKEEIAIRDQARYQANKKEIAAKRKAYREAHKEEIAERNKPYRKVCGNESQAIEALMQLSSSQNIDKERN
jgi:hypothetical protein